ncbi:unnamed protein product [Callosobruchus maculatus]|uniref:Uncharacterized protein n=1 Tax=Callosobruchus maculatus TaxID=64391 RepID=A0A653CA45_CALMS|nr:unnamed protein product [Callosobruchus maculatus]
MTEYNRTQTDYRERTFLSFSFLMLHFFVVRNNTVIHFKNDFYSRHHLHAFIVGYREREHIGSVTDQAVLW